MKKLRNLKMNRNTRVFRKIERDMKEKNRKLKKLTNSEKLKEESYVDKDRQIAVKIGKKLGTLCRFENAEVEMVSQQEFFIILVIPWW